MLVQHHDAFTGQVDVGEKKMGLQSLEDFADSFLSLSPAGHMDLVRCFHCKGGLKTWESSDKPWVEHSRWFPRCPFVRLCKGQRFVDAVQSLNDPNTRPTVSNGAVAYRVAF